MAMLKRKLTRLEQVCIVAIVFVLGGKLYMDHIYDPAMKRFRAVVSERRSLVGAIAALEGTPANPGVFRAALDEEKEALAEAERLSEAEKCLAKEEEIPGLLSQISRMVSSHGLRIRSFDPTENEGGKAPSAPRPPHKRSRHTLVLEGPFGGVKAFLSDLPQTPRIVTVARLHLAVAGTGTVRAEIVLEI